MAVDARVREMSTRRGSIDAMCKKGGARLCKEDKEAVAPVTKVGDRVASCD